MYLYTCQFVLLDTLNILVPGECMICMLLVKDIKVLPCEGSITRHKSLECDFKTRKFTDTKKTFVTTEKKYR